MLGTHTFLFLMVLLLIAAFLEPLAKKIHLPFTVILVMVGFVGSEIFVNQLGLDTGIRWSNFSAIIFYVILPVLIFQAALEINLKLLWRNALPILILAIPLMIASASFIAVGVYYGIDHTGFPWIAALLTGALLSATDPAAVLSLLKKTRAPKRLSLLLEGESLFNDATAIVLFSVLITVATGSLQGDSWHLGFVRFLTVFFGGLGVGILTGLIAHLLIKATNSDKLFIIISIACTYISFIVAEDFLHLSGVMAVLSSGLMVGLLDKERLGLDQDSAVCKFWDLCVYVGEALIFLLAGITITLAMFSDQWLAIVIGIASALIARLIVIYGLFPVFFWLPGVEPVSLKQQTVLVWGGVRGTVTIALALSLPLSLDYWYTVQSIAYGVVLFTLFVQSTTMNPLIKKLRIS